MPLFLLNLLPVLRRHWRAGLEATLAAATIASVAYGAHRYNLAERAQGAATERAAHAEDVAHAWAAVTATAAHQRDSVAAKLDTLGHTAPAVITRWRTITAPVTIPADGTSKAGVPVVPAVPLPDSVQQAGNDLVTQLNACLTDCAQFRATTAAVETGLTKRAETAEGRAQSLADSLRSRGAPLHLAGKAKIAGVGAVIGAALAAIFLHH